ncbi:MAG: D-glycero-beta-D-manno-heptose 1-phosphate adenylyltransferase, partial [Candidatus Latescibacterota bacterium]|nr:D-glycero-beta-D-manno-heptose 1-phosphate adenylyltransferase [Candidatus Latescibacterota bacterium]
RCALSIANGKGIGHAEFLPIRKDLSDTKRTLVFTNGCFDLLHQGHLHVLTEAQKLGDKLLVGLNSDESVQRIKGPDRPIDSLATRIANLSSVPAIDWIVTFDEDTPTALIESLRPDLLVKGGDYSLDEIVGRDTVESYGGRVTTIPILAGYSTTRIVLSHQKS